MIHAGEVVRDVRCPFQHEMRKRIPPEAQKPPRPVKRVRFNEAAGMTRVQDEKQWEVARERLDIAVRDALSEGNEVEIF